MTAVNSGGPTRPERVLIMGAAGRDFYSFNIVSRGDPSRRVIAFTTSQIPGVAGRRYPATLAGRLYPGGIPIYQEDELAALIRRDAIQWVYLCYSDLPHVEVMHKASVVLAAGASFGLLGPDATMLRAHMPVIAVCVVRTGAGESAVSRHVVSWLRSHEHRVVAVHHPMPYGDLARQAFQRFANATDLDAAEVTIEEREEYEPYLERGATVYAGIDYARILQTAEHEADVSVWDGGNNNVPFIRPDLHLELVDPDRSDDELAYYPDETNLRMADALIVTKVDSASAENIDTVLSHIRSVRPDTPVVPGELPLRVDAPERIAGRRVVVVEDGPTLTHGGLSAGAGTLAAQRWGAATIVDARPYATGSVAEAYQRFPHLRGEVPALGYSAEQVADLAETLACVPADAIVDATLVDPSRLIALNKPVASVSYAFRERGDVLQATLEAFERRNFPTAQPAGKRA